MGFNIDFELIGTSKLPLLQCEHCAKTFQRNRKADLQRHVRVHTNEKPYVCVFPDCGKSFKQSSALKNHANFHGRDKALSCSHCNTTFYDKPTLNRHVREKHELSEVFRCPLHGCGKSFKRKTVLKTHIMEKHEDVDLSVMDLSKCRVPASGNYRPGSCTSSTLRSEQLYAQTAPLPSLNDTLPNLTMESKTMPTCFPSAYGGSQQVWPDAMQLNNPFAEQNAKGSMPSMNEYMLSMGSQPNVYSSSSAQFYPSNPNTFDNSDPMLDPAFLDMFCGPDSISRPFANSAASMPPTFHISAASPQAALSPTRGIPPAMLMHHHQQAPQLTSPQPSLVYSSGSASSSRSFSPAQLRSRSGTASPVIPASAFASRRQSPNLY